MTDWSSLRRIIRPQFTDRVDSCSSIRVYHHLRPRGRNRMETETHVHVTSSMVHQMDDALERHHTFRTPELSEGASISFVALSAHSFVLWCLCEPEVCATFLLVLIFRQLHELGSCKSLAWVGNVLFFIGVAETACRCFFDIVGANYSQCCPMLVFSALRVFALWSHNGTISIVVGVLGLVPLGLNIVSLCDNSRVHSHMSLIVFLCAVHVKHRNIRGRRTAAWPVLCGDHTIT